MDRSVEADWPPMRRSTLSEDIADRLIASILSGKYKFGDKLPPERDLARYLAVGRPTVREAIRRLAVIGLLEVRPGEGTFVVNHHADFVAKAFGWAVLLDPRTAQEVVETRIAIEAEIAGLAASRATAEELGTLKELLEKMRRYRGDPKRFSEADLDFHMTLARATQNTTLIRLLEAIRSLLAQWITRALSHPEAFDIALEQHESVLSALERQDEAEARSAMRSHLIAMGDLFIAKTEAKEVLGRSSQRQTKNTPA
jgi:GntR family transcriptional repressor for pyruvate dehydrogenase complex